MITLLNKQTYAQLKKSKEFVTVEDETEEAKKFEALKPILCPKCNNANPATSLYCSVCNNALNEKAIKKEKAVEHLKEWLKDEDFIEMLDKYLVHKRIKT